MRKLAVVATCLFAVAALAEELTVDKILAAHSFGAPPEKIVERINDPANTVPPLAAGDLDKLRAAGVPETVIASFQARASLAPQPVQPDTPQLKTLVQLVKAGITETLIIEQIKQSGKSYALTPNDLIYLKENRVPDAIIATLMATGTAAAAVPGAAGVAAKASTDGAVEGLLLVRSSFLKKNHQGKLTFAGEEITWASAVDSTANFTVKAPAVQRAWMKCRNLPAGKLCFEIGFEIFKGESYNFRDVGAESGSNANVLKVRDILAARFPNLVFEEKIEK